VTTGAADAADATGAADAAERGAALPGAPQRVLFVCTHNSARSIMAEALLRQRGGDRYEVRSAGTHPGEVRALTLRVLRDAGLPTDELRSEPVESYLDEHFDLVVTVCDSAREECPVFPGSGQRLHWSFEDPSAATGSEEQRLAVFERVFDAIAARIDEFVS
jgi:arsenate reductase